MMAACFRCGRQTTHQYHYRHADGIAGQSQKITDSGYKTTFHTTTTYTNYRNCHVFICEACARAKIAYKKGEVRNSLIRIALSIAAWFVLVFLGGFVMGLTGTEMTFWYVAVRIVILIAGFALTVYSIIFVKNFFYHQERYMHASSGTLPEQTAIEMVQGSNPKGIYF